MKTFLLIIIVFCLFTDANAQVSGKIINTDSMPVAAVSIGLIKSSDSLLIKTVSSNEKGNYTIDGIASGKYLLKMSSIGYKIFYSPVFEIADSAKEKDFGVQIIIKETKQLEEVVIRAEKPVFQQRPEGMIVNTENSILTKGSTVLQVLERSPGVIINHRDNSISLNGKSGVMVMLNGKLMRMPIEQMVNLLDGMSADDVVSIELLTTPPAKYDAEGSAGLINIVTKKTKKLGTNANVSATVGYGTGEKLTGSANLSYNTKNVSLFGSYTYSRNRSYTDIDITSSQSMPVFGGDASVLYYDTTHVVSTNHDAHLGMDIKLSNKTTIGASVAYNNSSRPGNTVTSAGYNILPDSLIAFNGLNKGTNNWNNLVNSIYLEKNIRTGEKINFDADYLLFKNDGASTVQSSFINKHGEQAGSNQILFAPQQRSFMNTTIKVGVAKMDYAKQLTQKIKLETGLKGAYTQSESLSGIQSLVNNVWTSSDQTSDYIKMKEGIGAVYFSVNSQITPSVSLVTGVRYEYSYTNMDNSKTGENIVNRKLGSFFPSVFFSKKINDNETWLFSYTKRISRPSYNDLASFVGYSDPTAVYTGNPFLKPTITNNIKLGYNYKTFSFAVLYSHDDNPIARYQLTESPAKDILYISPQNVTWQNNLYFETSLPFKINNWWSMNYSFEGGLQQYKVDYSLQPFKESYFNYSFSASQTFKLNKGFSAELSGDYNNTAYNGTQKVKGFGVVNLGIKKELNNNAGSFQLSVADLLRMQRYDIHYGSIAKEAFDIKSHVIVNTESSKFPIIKLTYSRSFGGGAKSETKQNGSQDERERVRQ